MKNLGCTGYIDDPAKYLNAVRGEWDKFLKTGDIHGLSVRGEILESWKRSLENGLSYSDSGASIVLSEDEVDRLGVKYGMLISVAQPVLDDFAMMLKRYSIKNTVINLCTEDTVILRTFAGETSGERAARYQGLLPGAILNEKHTGTTGVSMAKKTRQTYAIYGEEHFTEPAKLSNCVAAPISNLRNKRLNGIIALSAEKLAISSDTMGMVAFVARTIESNLLMAYTDAAHMLEQGFSEAVRRNDAELVVALDSGFDVIASSRPRHPMLEGQFPFQTLGASAGAQLRRVNAQFLYGLSAGAKARSCETDEYAFRCAPVFGAESYVGMIVCADRRRVPQAQARPPRGAAPGGPAAPGGETRLVGSAPAFTDACRMAMRAAASDAPIMLIGETGVGKERFARMIHENSGRSGGAFVPVNCGAIPKDLVGSELFGYVPGAFTGALHKGSPGKIEAASGGTLFFDELGSLPLEAQSYLLRALEERELFRLGSNRPIPVDARIVCATNADLAESVARKEFRSDLYFRLNVVEIRIPPLRERFDDMSELISFFSAMYSGEGCALGAAELEHLMRYSWPGNLRELRNVTQGAHALGVGVAQALRAHVDRNMGRDGTAQMAQEPGPCCLDPREEAQRAVERHGGNISRAARHLGVARSTIYRRLEKPV
ncbi:MAG: sigma 54-interacting transcriptional regulator [Clostridiales Family XIII bacterium]|jgi:transcriptional regulator of acetoin/glycerol metabolism|nr:sigma 54-interacting transcriptional regulator [Clostridiales Family XIII bacterium]